MKKYYAILILLMISNSSFAGLLRKDTEEEVLVKKEIADLKEEIRKDKKNVVINRNAYSANKRYGLDSNLDGEKFKLNKSEEKLRTDQDALKSKKKMLSLLKKNNKSALVKK